MPWQEEGEVNPIVGEVFGNSSGRSLTQADVEQRSTGVKQRSNSFVSTTPHD